MNKLIVVGGGGFAKEVIWLAEDCGFEIVGVLDDNPDAQISKIAGYDVLGTISDWVDFKECYFVVAIGSPRTRKLVVDKMSAAEERPNFAKLVHPSVIKSPRVNFGQGTIVSSGMTFTVDIEVGEHCIFNLNGTVGHECQIGDFVTVAPMSAISGNVEIKDLAEIGTGAAVRQGVTIGKGSMVGMGAVLTKNVPNCEIFAGNPAKFLKELPTL